jgi:hypothetical protein
MARLRADREQAEREKKEALESTDSNPGMSPCFAQEERGSSSSEARIRANRESARKSTGPKSPEGKARASRNALTHGLLARDVVNFGENAQEFDAFREGMMADLAPEGDTEEYLADRVVESAWRLRRIPRVETRGLLNWYEHKFGSEHPLDQLDEETRLATSEAVTAELLWAWPFSETS